MVESKFRDIGLDIVRCSAILLVILQHSWSGMGFDTADSSIRCWFYSVFCLGVPLFVLLSGSLQFRRTEEPAEFLSNRFRRILVPFFIWSALVYVISAVMGKYHSVGTVKEAISFYFTFIVDGDINKAYWYIYMLVGLYLITPVLQKAFNPDTPSSRKLLEYCLWLWVGIQVFKDICPDFLTLKYWSFPVDKYLGYYLAGLYVGRYVTDRAVLRKYGGTGFLVSAGIAMLLAAKGQHVVFVEMSEAVCLFMYLKSLTLPEGRAKELVTDFSRYSYTIYLTHIILVGALCSAVRVDLFATPVFIVMVAAVLEYFFCSCLEKIKSIPGWILGFK